MAEAHPATRSPTGQVRRIDVHHHYMSEAYVEAIGLERIARQAASRTVPSWRLEWSLEFMDLLDIQTAILSVSAPGIGLDTPEQTAGLGRRCNDDMARFVADRPQRVGMFAALPLPDLDSTLEEITHAFDALRADGVSMMSNYHGVHIGNPRFWPVLEELNRRKAVVAVHPTAPFGFSGIPGISVSTLEFPFETTRAIVSMLLHGSAAKFPNIRFIWSHAGGTLPFLAGRTAVLSSRHSNFKQKGHDGILPALRNFYYDITQSTSQATFTALRDVAPLCNLLFGSDAPFAVVEMAQLTIQEMSQLRLDQQELEAISRDNAIALFPRLAH